MSIIPTTAENRWVAAMLVGAVRVGAMLVGALVAGALVLGACGSDGDEARTTATETAGVPAVVASFYPLAEVAARVGGDRVAVTNLTPAGSEPHDLELSPADVEALHDAALVVALGGGFQPAVETVAGRRDGSTVVVFDDLRRAGEMSSDAGDEGPLDPHVWLDPTLMVAVVDSIGEALSAVDPAGAPVFEANAARYVAELEALDASFSDTLADCERSSIVVAHDAFGYLTARYGLTQEAIVGLSPGAEPSPSRLAELADLVEAEGTTTVFTETLVSPRVAETLAREAGVVTAVIDPLEGLSADQLSAGATYESVMRDNLGALATALGCRGAVGSSGDGS